jgi:triphosphoribosyl-dephospho-CoA synthase
MNSNTFYNSIEALRGYFGQCFAAGIEGAEFRTLQAHGLAAEKAMFKATGGVNTHKGAIFFNGLARRCSRRPVS